MRNRSLRRSLLLAGLALSPAEVVAGCDDADRQRQVGSVVVEISTGPRLPERSRVMDARAGEFIAAHNATDPAAVVAFELHNRSAGAGAFLSLESRLDQAARWREEWGELDVHSVTPVGNGSLAMLARSERTGRWVYVTLVFEPAAPFLLHAGRVDEVTVPRAES